MNKEALAGKAGGQACRRVARRLDLAAAPAPHTGWADRYEAARRGLRQHRRREGRSRQCLWPEPHPPEAVARACSRLRGTRYESNRKHEKADAARQARMVLREGAISQGPTETRPSPWRRRRSRAERRVARIHKATGLHLREEMGAHPRQRQPGAPAGGSARFRRPEPGTPPLRTHAQRGTVLLWAEAADPEVGFDEREMARALRSIHCERESGGMCLGCP